MYDPVHPSRPKPELSGDGGGAGSGRLPPIARRAAVPVLLAAAVLAGIGAVLSIAWLVDTAVVLAIATVAAVLVRRSIHSNAPGAHDQGGRRRRRCC